MHVRNFDDDEDMRVRLKKNVILYSDYNYFLRELVHLGLSRYSLQSP